MSASPDTSFFDPNISELSEDEPLSSSAPSLPRIKLKLRLNPTASSSTNHNHDDNSSKKHKRKKKRSQRKHKHDNHTDDEEQQHPLRRHSELVDIDEYEQPSDSDNDDDKYPDYAHMPVGGKRPFAMLAQDTQDDNNKNDDIDTDATYTQPVYDEDEEQSYTEEDDQRMDEDDTYIDDYDDEVPDELNSVYPTDTLTSTPTATPTTKKTKTSRSSKTASKTSSKARGKSSKQSSKDTKSKSTKKRGRPIKKAQAKSSASSAALSSLTSQPLKQEQQQYQGIPTSKDHGKGLKATCLKLWDTLSKRDAYGFFLEPVDTNLVRDYLTVIKQPMDFTTLYSKIENDNYKTMDDFRTDFLLIVHNAKLYNAPDTIYWKSADKLENYGIKAIERAEKLVQEPVTTTQSHRSSFSTYLGNQQYAWQQQQQSKSSYSQKNVPAVKEEEVDILGLDGPARKGSRAESERPTRETSLDPNSRAMTPMRQQQPKKKKKKKVTDSGVIYGPDGSIHAIGGVNDLYSLLPKKQSFSDPPQLTTINPQALPSAFYQPNRSIHDDWASHKHFSQPAIFCDYGPFPFTTLGSSTPAMFYQQQDARYVYSLYGDDTGEAYLKSLWRFLDDLGLGERATTLSRTITRGAFDVMAAVVDNMENSTDTHEIKDGDDNDNNKSSLVLDTELGEVDIGALLRELQQQKQTDDTSSTKTKQQNQQTQQSTSLQLQPSTSDENVGALATGSTHASESPSPSSAPPVNTT